MGRFLTELNIRYSHSGLITFNKTIKSQVPTSDWPISPQTGLYPLRLACIPSDPGGIFLRNAGTWFRRNPEISQEMICRTHAFCRIWRGGGNTCRTLCKPTQTWENVRAREQCSRKFFLWQGMLTGCIFNTVGLQKFPPPRQMRQNARVLQIISCELSGFRRNQVPAFLRKIPPWTCYMQTKLK